jgi:aryl-alcohol dehydrogenase-like predicted oxidoreductase
MSTATEQKTENKHKFQVDRSKHVPSLASYYLLGRSGLRVSPLAFGAGTFGSKWGDHWSIDKATAKSILKRYFEAGGNFVDTADSYHDGESEEITGELVRDLTKRDRVVIATKFSFGMHPGDPNGGGNGRKHILDTLDGSLRRLKTDYIDLYWLHNWDTITPVEEVMSTLNSVVQSGKVRYIGLSNPPAWFLGRAQTMAQLRGWEPISAIQMQYSLAMRNIEFEYTDAAIEMGIGICPWSPLANGMLTGKYKVSSEKVAGDGRLANAWTTDPFNDPKSERNINIVKTLVEVAEKLGHSPAQVALNWVTTQPGVNSSIIGASKLTQLEDNIQALEFEIPAELRQRLDDVSKPPLSYPYFFHTGELNEGIRCGMPVSRHHSGYYKD